ncbi:hypothetical protein PHYBLDRAFT_161870 [Phycomyces blakesleeanus NRRL 1555(-)]|uniref:Uncharacterized protein n=1 Tax=Phycomyces blakesleeanus (strain ATCC 8743b / DSM 1359 / FGSC 10004 / NBRC 33097 / NRRL 1555) TaxID=763407 RepID=A0A163ESC9_PHYB8|nr:hypothetical protein PHYBLDRAFT_161870 [Phycomyces blakesleeanus NRRL 1555(-)]OAD81250.1 hypothetical protein PHYBLDRAFT_161870 [Phycomyces blakesleeanus NRRL 1555(-)]|eukprot:XP_018299290.1 hypothetical protein PHYBLDRAFT_161870 [Phycomyces blakesleeanus NRRL 1555(-)]
MSKTQDCWILNVLKSFHIWEYLRWWQQGRYTNAYADGLLLGCRARVAWAVVSLGWLDFFPIAFLEAAKNVVGEGVGMVTEPWAESSTEKFSTGAIFVGGRVVVVKAKASAYAKELYGEGVQLVGFEMHKTETETEECREIIYTLRETDMLLSLIFITPGIAEYFNDSVIVARV